jgi:hypothetical protein
MAKSQNYNTNEYANQNWFSDAVKIRIRLKKSKKEEKNIYFERRY